MIKLTNIQATARKRQLFQTEELSVERGGLLALIGKNGAGKSTFLKALAGLESLVSGQISIEGTTYTFGKDYFPSKRVSYIPVKIVPFGAISLLDFVLSGKSTDRNFLDVPKREEQEEVKQLLSQFNMEHMAQDAFENLSDGEQKLALIMRSVYRNADVLLLDEPESFLDVSNRKLVFEWLKQLSEQGKTIIFSTHQPDLAAQYASGFLTIHEGEIRLESVDKLNDIVNEIF
jgi:iron complex transport system ATP-binding protein